MFVDGTCDFCEFVYANAPRYLIREDSADLKKGRVYTIARVRRESFRGKTGLGVVTEEVPLGGEWMHCSCQFREIDGDAEAWHRLMEENRPRTKELEPA